MGGGDGGGVPPSTRPPPGDPQSIRSRIYRYDVCVCCMTTICSCAGTHPLYIWCVRVHIHMQICSRLAPRASRLHDVCFVRRRYVVARAHIRCIYGIRVHIHMHICSHMCCSHMCYALRATCVTTICGVYICRTKKTLGI